MAIIDRSTIENLINKVDENVIEQSLSTFSFIISKSMEDLSKKNAMVSTNFELIPINEFCSGAILPNSKITFLLAMKSPQLEFNTVKLINNKLKSFWYKVKYAWKNRKKKTKKHKYINEVKVEQNSKDTYTMNNFNVDLLNNISNNIANDTIVSLNNGILEISGANFPFLCEIYPVIDKNGTYNFYLPRKNKFYNLDFKNRFKYLEELQEEFDENYINLLKMFWAVYYTIYNTRPNCLFIESLIANLPQDAFLQKDIYSCFVYAVNYLINKPSSKMFAITDFSKKLIDEPLTETSVVDLATFMKDLQKYL